MPFIIFVFEYQKAKMFPLVSPKALVIDKTGVNPEISIEKKECL
jgi:hypothetical protein